MMDVYTRTHAHNHARMCALMHPPTHARTTSTNAHVATSLSNSNCDVRIRVRDLLSNSNCGTYKVFSWRSTNLVRFCMLTTQHNCVLARRYLLPPGTRTYTNPNANLNPNARAYTYRCKIRLLLRSSTAIVLQGWSPAAGAGPAHRRRRALTAKSDHRGLHLLGPSLCHAGSAAASAQP